MNQSMSLKKQNKNETTFLQSASVSPTRESEERLRDADDCRADLRLLLIHFVRNFAIAGTEILRIGLTFLKKLNLSLLVK